MDRTLPWQPCGLLLGPELLKISRVQGKKMKRLDGSFTPKCLSPTPNPHGKRGGVYGFDDSFASFPPPGSASAFTE